MTDADQGQHPWVVEYEALRTVYAAFVADLLKLFPSLLARQGVDIAHIEGREKSPRSLEEKLARKGDKYSRLADIVDLAGVRLVFVYQSDLDRARDILFQEFIIDPDNSVNKATELATDRFGYLSYHVVLQVGAPRRDLSEWQPYRALWVEVQLRTVAQHAWAAIQHKLSYKREGDVPERLQRSMFRLSALLELADEQFESIRSKHDEIEADYSQTVADGALDRLPIDADSVSAYLRDGAVEAMWRPVANRVGFSAMPTDARTMDAIRSGDLSDLVHVLTAAGIDSVEALSQFLTEAAAWGSEALGDIASVWRDERALPFGPTLENIITMLVVSSPGVDAGLAAQIYDRSIARGVSRFRERRTA